MFARRILLSALLVTGLAAPLLAGPPWISIELPPNPFDAASRNAVLLVHAFHYRQNANEGVTGRAVGIVNGVRRTMTLQLDRTSRPGVFALRNTWGSVGAWTLILTASQEHGHAAEVMVKMTGARVIAVEAATEPSQHAELPVMSRRFTEAEIEASLRR
ncbi:MAG: hypothetical protein KF785_00745 [Gemmatimonadales bacterium]|nr:hypothetical protein [Gemmatimonadales bacterium]